MAESRNPFRGAIRLRAPQYLGVFQDRQARTLNFLARVRKTVALANGRPVVVDFSNCKHISRAGCLLLTAALERARQCMSGPVGFDAPDNDDMADLFDAFGVYHYFNLPSPLSRTQRRNRSRYSMVVRSSDVHEKTEIKYKLADVAGIARYVCRTSQLGVAVEEALQEAMQNTQHAYEGMDMTDWRGPKWWFAGLFDREKSEAFFYALDHGQGIPKRAQVTLAPELASYWPTDVRFADAAAGRPSDQDLLEAAIKAPRLNQEGRGKGLPTIMSLLDFSTHGAVRIHSGQAHWHSARKAAASRDERPTEHCYRLGSTFPGTLVSWRVAGPL